MVRRAGSSVLVALALLASAACNDDPDRPPPAGDLPQAPPGTGVTGGGGGGDGGAVAEGGGRDAAAGTDGAAACNDLPNRGIVVEQQAVVGDPVAGSGGTVVDGTYELTEATVFVGAGGTPGPTGVQLRAALRIEAGNFARVVEQSRAGVQPQESRASGSLTTAGPNATFAAACPFASQDAFSYSVVQTGIVLTSFVTRESLTFTLR